MQVKALILAIFASTVVAQGSVCFDDTDCVLEGAAGATCTRTGGFAILG